MMSTGDMRSESMKWNLLAQMNPASSTINKINKSAYKSNYGILDSENSLNQAQLRFTHNSN